MMRVYFGVQTKSSKNKSCDIVIIQLIRQTMTVKFYVYKKAHWHYTHSILSAPSGA